MMRNLVLLLRNLEEIGWSFFMYSIQFLLFFVFSAKSENQTFLPSLGGSIYLSKHFHFKLFLVFFRLYIFFLKKSFNAIQRVLILAEESEHELLFTLRIFREMEQFLALHEMKKMFLCL